GIRDLIVTGVQTCALPIFNGAVIGSLYALVGMGIILVYRANRIINFASAALGSVPAVIALILISRKGLPYLAAIPIVLIGAAVRSEERRVGKECRARSSRE